MDSLPQGQVVGGLPALRHRGIDKRAGPVALKPPGDQRQPRIPWRNVDLEVALLGRAGVGSPPDETAAIGEDVADPELVGPAGSPVREDFYITRQAVIELGWTAG